MMNNSCTTCSSGSPGGISVGSGDRVVELIRVLGIEEANRLLTRDYAFISMYYHPTEQQEVYILAKLKPAAQSRQPIGFIPK
ncbi:hypothetical protein [Desulforamulus ruminis]|uniref:Uncharacterized protein n=1 Tax=Desulforamulus ruminis (strain ATCC 23193 / DSM 2154 / NCIMB 8452 / DL) TaxID=696281 RepID=F6DTM4_DESRL|nr:hypothetical protein [Desulforamulus ruminis]AEG61198.1 hypothetical protein Desru_2985 [Desulforamulus ruminis DSM 2154]